MGFLHAYGVLWETVHNLCQIAVYGREDGYSDAEVRRPEKGLLTVGAEFLHVFLMVFHPTCRTRNHLHVVGESLQIVAVSGSRVGKLDGNIGRAELRTVDILRVIHVNLTYDFVATLQGNLLDHVSHLSVADQSYFHLYLNFICFTLTDISVWQGEGESLPLRLCIVILCLLKPNVSAKIQFFL